jgi:predicted alpha/beta-hydrolase family hydrolase
MSAEKRIDTPHGEARLVTHRARSPRVTVLLSHGAGNGIDTADLEALAQHLPGQGVTVVRLEQPWKVAGRKVATPPRTLDDGLAAAASVLRLRTPLVVGGRSAGARSAARSAVGLGAVGCLALAFPLHPPGRPEKSRLTRDTMGRPEEFPADLDHLDLCVVPGADHGLKVPKSGVVSQDDALGIIVESTLEWLVREVVGSE